MHASKLCLPLWALIHTARPQSAEQSPIFSTTDRMVAFVKWRTPADWCATLIARSHQAILFIADQQAAECPGMLVDCEPDGSGGTFYTLAEFMDAVSYPL